MKRGVKVLSFCSSIVIRARCLLLTIPLTWWRMMVPVLTVPLRRGCNVAGMRWRSITSERGSVGINLCHESLLGKLVDQFWVVGMCLWLGLDYRLCCKTRLSITPTAFIMTFWTIIFTWIIKLLITSNSNYNICNYFL